MTIKKTATANFGRFRDAADLESARIVAARQALQNAGGPRALARKLSDYLDAEIDEKRVSKWRTIGVPVRWGVIVEHVTGVKREQLNPYEYTITTQVFHRLLSREYLLKTIASKRQG